MSGHTRKRRASTSGQIGGTPADKERLQATLRLLFDDQTADRIVLGAGNVFQAASRRWTIEAWKTRIGRRQRVSQSGSSLAPSTRIPARGAVGLALHLGMGESTAALAERINVSPVQLGADLFKTRATLVNGATVCREFTSSIGRYRDPSLDITDRASLLHHVQHCDACRSALKRFQVVDAQLLDQIEREAAELDHSVATAIDKRPAIPLSGRGVATAAIALLLLVAVVYGAVRVRPGKNAPGTSTDTDRSLTGWLLTQDIYGTITAINLTTGQRHVIDQANSQATNLQYGVASTLLSPNQQLIAAQRPVEYAQPHSRLTIETIDGVTIQEIAFTDAAGYTLAGWLGNGTVLEIQRPQSIDNESQDAYAARLRTESVLLAIDVRTGARRQLFRGALTSVYPSPDSTIIAVKSNPSGSNVSDPLFSITLYSLENGTVGSPIVTLGHQIFGDPVWAPDSSRIYIGAATDDTATPAVAVGPQTEFPNPFARRLRLVQIDRTGKMEDLPRLPTGESNIPISISPDGQDLISASVSPSEAANNYHLWRTDPSGKHATMVDGSFILWIGTGIWSPDGRALLVQNYTPFMLSPSMDETALGDIASTTLLAVHPDGQTETIRSQLGGPFGFTFLGWLPTEAIPTAHVPATSGGAPRDVAPIDLRERDLELDPTSEVNSDGPYVILRDHILGQPVIWDRSTDQGRQLPAGTTDLSWLESSQVLLAVGQTNQGQLSDLSRLMTFAPTFNGSVPSYDFRSFDPADLGSDTGRQYASPRVAPDESAISFFVRNARDGSISLWVSGYRRATQSVYRWDVPANSMIGATLAASWVDNSTLIFAEPGDWHDGLPRHVALNRLKLNRDGTSHVDTVVTLRTHGNERGIDLRELAIDSATGHIAYRLRHFTQASVTNGTFDSVDIATSTHLDSPIELSRQGTGIGLAWSPDGSVLAATFQGELRFYSNTGLRLGTLSGLSDPSSPTWVSPTEVWFEAVRDRTEQIMSVQVH